MWCATTLRFLSKLLVKTRIEPLDVSFRTIWMIAAASDQVRAAALSTLNSSIAIATFKAALGPNDASIDVKVLSLRDSSTNTHEGESMISGGLVYVISAAGMLLSLAATTVLLRRRDSKLKHDLQTIMSRY
ncbi:hypothetical protein DYB34_007813, partial [Aphanomyces astaci]